MTGTTIEWGEDGYTVGNDPIIPFIEGDGIGPDIWSASQRVFDAAVEKVSGGERRVVWKEILAGEKAHEATGEWLPEATLEAIRDHRIAIKGPLRLNVVIFRENLEDVYAGIEYQAGSADARKVRDFLVDNLGADILESSAIGIKPMSEYNSKKLVCRAIGYALDRGRESVTLVHKGNIMKFTEGAFKDWGYEAAEEGFSGRTVRESDSGGSGDKVVIKDRIADAMFQQLLLRPDEYSVIATSNLNGDYLSDACAAQVGGLGLAPGANMGDGVAIFEATHGTAPKYAGQDKVNPGSVILSGVMMFEEMGWDDVAESIVRGIEGAIADGTVTYDLARQMSGATEVATSGFADAIINNL